MTNNDILKKLRIALDLKEDEMYFLFELGGHAVNKSMLSGMFRKQDHKNYRECSDELLTSFLDGYIIHKRGKKAESSVEESEQ